MANSVVHAVLLTYSLLGSAAWFLCTRRWTKRWRGSAYGLFGLCWLGITWNSKADGGYDPDLGIQLASISWRDAALYSFPLTLTISLAVIGAGRVLKWFLNWIGKCWSMETLRASASDGVDATSQAQRPVGD